VNDTPDQVKHLFRTMMMARSAEERMVMGCSMFDAARKMALASLSHLPERQINLATIAMIADQHWHLVASAVVAACRRTSPHIDISCR